MKSMSLIRHLAAFGVIALAYPAAFADNFDCFPLCADVSPTNAATPTACNAPSSAAVAVEKIEGFNDKLKPAKEIAGSLQSPQRLAL